MREKNACTVRNDDVIIRAYDVTCTTSHTYSSIRIRNTSIYKTQLTDRIVFFFRAISYFFRTIAFIDIKAETYGL